MPGPAFLLPAQDRYRLFAQRVLPVLLQARAVLAALYCGDNGRPCIEPVLLLALSVLQFWERVPDTQAVALLNWHVGWAFAVGWEIGQPLFHPSGLSRFRQLLLEHKQAALVFEQLVQGLVQGGLIKGQAARRVDWTFVLGLVSHRGRLECVRETLRLALEQLAKPVAAGDRPALWPVWWERYVENQLDYRAQLAVLQTKLCQAGQDSVGLLGWIDQNSSASWASASKVQLLRRVFAEHFETAPVGASAAAPVSHEKTAAQPAAAMATAAPPVPRDKTPAGAVKNPHDPEAQWAKKGSGAQKKEVVGYKVQVSETVPDSPTLKGQPTQQFLTALETQPATASDERGLEQVVQAETRQQLPPAPTLYVDAAYISGAKLAQAQAQGRALIGPAPAPPHWQGRYSAADFDVTFDPLQACCPAGHRQSAACQWQDGEMGGVATRFDWKEKCQACPQRAQCVSPDRSSRTLAIGPHHQLLQQRRREQTTPEFRQRCKQRNALEGTQSELVRAHGLRKARYRGLEKTRLQNYFIGAACNAKRWIRLLQWRARHITPAVCTDISKN